MFVTAVVCPGAPGMVTPLAGSAAGGFDQARDVAVDAVRRLVAAEPDRVVVLAAHPVPATADTAMSGSMRGFGVPVDAGEGPRLLPASHTVGAWLLDAAGWTGPRRYVASAVDSEKPREALLVVADGSARRSVSAPGFLDPRAEGFDQRIADALRDGDAEALACLDPALGHELLAEGVAPLRRLGEMTKGARITAELHLDAAPLGVGYFVASWQIS